MTALEARQRWIAMLEAAQRPLNTRKAYDSDVASLCAFLERTAHQGSADVRAIDLAALRKWLSARTDEKLGAASRARCISVVRMWMRWLERVGEIVTAAPAEDLRIPRVAERFPVFLNKDDAAKLVEAPRVIARTRLPEAERVDRALACALLELLYGSGLRVSECVGLDLGHVELEERQALVRGKGDVERIVPLGRKSVEAIRAWLQQLDLVFDQAKRAEGKRKLAKALREMETRYAAKRRAERLREGA